MRRASAAALALLAFVGGCSDASGGVQGGEARFDAGESATAPDASAPTFSSLYGAFFGHDPSEDGRRRLDAQAP